MVVQPDLRFLAIWLSLGNGPGECIRNLFAWGASPQERTWPKARRNLFWYAQFSNKISGSALMRDSPHWTVTPVRARAMSFVYTVQAELRGAWDAADSKCWLTDWQHSYYCPAHVTQVIFHISPDQFLSGPMRLCVNNARTMSLKTPQDPGAPACCPGTP